VSSAALVGTPTAKPLRSHAFQKLFSFPVMLASLLVVLAVLTVRSRFDDPDMWWHLKLGQVIWTTHSIPVTDIFSYTTNHHSSIPHEWLSQLIIYGAYRLGGYSGLMLYLCVFTAILLIVGYGLCAAYSGNAKVSFLGALIIWLFATVGFSIRPQMIGYLLLIVALLLLHLGRIQNPRWFFCLPPLFAIWVNCHGSFFLGLTVAGTVLISSFFTFRIGSLVSRPWNPHRRRMLAMATILSVAALFLNPIGVKQVLYPITLMLNQPINLSQVSEWQPLQLTDVRTVGFLGTIGCVFSLVISLRSEIFWDELLLLVIAIWLAASHQRMLFVFGIISAPILSRLLSALWNNYSAERDHFWPNVALITMSLLVAFWSFPDRPNLTRQMDAQSPVQAVEFIRTSHLSGRMLNDYAFGGYLIWAAPEHPVFVDGRSDVFEWTGVLGDYGSWATLQSDPHTLLDKYKVDFCLLARPSQMARVMPLLRGWKSIYVDKISVIFVRAKVEANLK